jgi:putative glycosyltransferase
LLGCVAGIVDLPVGEGEYLVIYESGDCDMMLSIVTTLYKSASYIEEFHRRASEAAKLIAGNDYEIVMVDDGSPDNGIEIALTTAEYDPRLKVVELSRNFGHHTAMMTGLQFAEGDLVFIIDVDLEEEPELLIAFFNEFNRKKVDVVYGVQSKRKGGWFERYSGDLFYSIFNHLSDIPIPRNKIMAHLMSRQYLNALLCHQERSPFLAGIVAITGFKQEAFVCAKKSKGNTSYTLAKKINQCVDSVTSFSVRPLYYIFYLGLLVVSCSAIGFIYLLLMKIFTERTTILGWTSLMLLMCAIFGIVMLSLGIIGLYMSKIFIEVKKRPYSIVKNVCGHNEKEYHGRK